MARSSNATVARPGTKQIRAKAAVALSATGPTRVDLLVEVIDQCTAAKDNADGIGEKFLSYLLAMAIQESRTAMRRIPAPPRD